MQAYQSLHDRIFLPIQFQLSYFVQLIKATLKEPGFPALYVKLISRTLSLCNANSNVTKQDHIAPSEGDKRSRCTGKLKMLKPLIGSGQRIPLQSYTSLKFLSNSSNILHEISSHKHTQWQRKQNNRAFDLRENMTMWLYTGFGRFWLLGGKTVILRHKVDFSLRKHNFWNWKTVTP